MKLFASLFIFSALVLQLGVVTIEAQPNANAMPIDLSQVANVEPWPKDSRKRFYLDRPDWNPPDNVIGIPIQFPDRDQTRVSFYQPDLAQPSQIPVASEVPLYGVVIVHGCTESIDEGQVGWQYRFVFADNSDLTVPVRQGFEVASRWKDARSVKAYELWRGDNGATEVSVQALPVAFPRSVQLSKIEVLPGPAIKTSPLILAVTGLTRYQDVEHLAEVITDQQTSDPQASSNERPLEELETLTLRWDQPLGEISPLLYGTNIAGTFSDPNHPTRAAYMRSRYSIFDLPAYHKYMSNTGFPLIRIHSSDVANRITNAESRSLDKNNFAAEMNRQFAWAKGANPPAIVFTIPKPPKWLAAEESDLSAAEFDAIYAKIAADAAEVARSSVDIPVRYWEPFNEQERRYPDRRDVLWDRWIAVAKAIRQVDPEAKMIGPTLCWPDSSILKDFISHVDAVDPELLDVVSWHRYGFGRTPPTDDAELLIGMDKFGDDVRRVRKLVDELRPGRETPLFIGEFNISYVWEPCDPRQSTHVGAAWFATVLQHAIRSGLEMSANWHLDMTGFGMLDVVDGQLTKTPSADLYPALIKHLRGQAYEVAGATEKLESIASRHGSGRSALLIHKDHGRRTIAIDLGAAGESEAGLDTINCMTIDADGTSVKSIPVDVKNGENLTATVTVNGITTVLLWFDD